MTCTVLIDNQPDVSRRDLQHEHGLSVLVQSGASTVLFDSGASDSFLSNAIRLGVDIHAIDAFVLSHGHYDHGGGLAAFLKANTSAPAYCAPGAMDTHLAKLAGFLNKDIGLNMKVLRDFSNRFVTVTDATEIATGVYVLPRIMLSHQAPKDLDRFYKKSGGRLQRDTFDHEMLLALKEPDGLTVLTGCSHKGILNVVAAATANFPGLPVKALIGGLHMTNPATKRLAESPERIAAVGTAIRDNSAIDRLYVGHCTGAEAYALLKKQLGTRIEPLKVGKQIAA